MKKIILGVILCIGVLPAFVLTQSISLTITAIDPATSSHNQLTVQSTGTPVVLEPSSAFLEIQPSSVLFETSNIEKTLTSDKIIDSPITMETTNLQIGSITSSVREQINGVSSSLTGQNTEALLTSSKFTIESQFPSSESLTDITDSETTLFTESLGSGPVGKTISLTLNPTPSFSELPSSSVSKELVSQEPVQETSSNILATSSFGMEMKSSVSEQTPVVLQSVSQSTHFSTSIHVSPSRSSDFDSSSTFQQNQENKISSSVISFPAPINSLDTTAFVSKSSEFTSSFLRFTSDLYSDIQGIKESFTSVLMPESSKVEILASSIIEFSTASSNLELLQTMSKMEISSTSSKIDVSHTRSKSTSSIVEIFSRSSRMEISPTSSKLELSASSSISEISPVNSESSIILMTSDLSSGSKVDILQTRSTDGQTFLPETSFIIETSSEMYIPTSIRTLQSYMTKISAVQDKSASQKPSSALPVSLSESPASIDVSTSTASAQIISEIFSSKVASTAPEQTVHFGSASSIMSSFGSEYISPVAFSTHYSSSITGEESISLPTLAISKSMFRSEMIMPSSILPLETMLSQSAYSSDHQFNATSATVDSTLILTNFTTSSVYQDTSGLIVESRSVPVVSEGNSMTISTPVLENVDTVSTSIMISSFQGYSINTDFLTFSSGISSDILIINASLTSALFSPTNVFQSSESTNILLGNDTLIESYTISSSTLTESFEMTTPLTGSYVMSSPLTGNATLAGSYIMSTPLMDNATITESDLMSSPLTSYVMSTKLTESYVTSVTPFMSENASFVSDVILTPHVNISQTASTVMSITESVLMPSSPIETNASDMYISQQSMPLSTTNGVLTPPSILQTLTFVGTNSFTNISVEQTLTVLNSSEFQLTLTDVLPTETFNISSMTSILSSQTLKFSLSVETVIGSVQETKDLITTMATDSFILSLPNLTVSSVPSHSETIMPSVSNASAAVSGYKNISSTLYQSESSEFASLLTTFGFTDTPTASIILSTFEVTPTQSILSSYISENRTVAMETSPQLETLLPSLSNASYLDIQTSFVLPTVSGHSFNGSFESVSETAPLSSATSMIDFNQSSLYLISTPQTAISSLTSAQEISLSVVTPSYQSITENFSANIDTLTPSTPVMVLPSIEISNASHLASVNLTLFTSSHAIISSFSATLAPSGNLNTIALSTSDVSGLSTPYETPVLSDSSLFDTVMTSSELVLQTVTSSMIVLNETSSITDVSAGISTGLMMSSSAFSSLSTSYSGIVEMSASVSQESLSVNQTVELSSVQLSTTQILPTSAISAVQGTENITSVAQITSSEPVLHSTTTQVTESTAILPSTMLTKLSETVLPTTSVQVLSSVPVISSLVSMSSLPVSSVSTTSVPPTTTSSTTTRSTTTTPTTRPATTTQNLADTYWVRTVIKVPLAENVSSPAFQTDMETKLIQAYDTAYERQKQIAEGTFNPLKKRRKRYTKVGDTAVDMQSVTRSSGNVSMVYTVEKSGTLVPASEVVTTMGVLSDQEMALILQYVVATKAETYKKTGYDDVGASQPSNLWIIGVAIGGAVLVIIVIWIILCCVVKKQRAAEKGETNQGEPHLIGMKGSGEEGEEGFDGNRVNPKYIEEVAERGDNSKYQIKSPKHQMYEVNSEEPEYAQVKKTKRPPSNKKSDNNKSQASLQGGSDNENATVFSEDAELIQTPSKTKRSKKQRKKKPPDDIENDEVMAKSYHPVSQMYIHGDSLPEPPPYSAEEEEELRKRKEQERKKNKQRIREKKQREKKEAKTDEDVMKEYLASQQEIDMVLEAPPEDGLPDVFKDKSSTSQEKKSKKEDMSYSNDAFSGDESLQEARKKMHRLLDDAFSLISPSASFDGRGLTSQSRIFHLYPDVTSYSSVNTGKTQEKEEKKHEPLHINPPAYRPGEEPGLTTWSPYRAADEVALISMPKKMQTSVVSRERKGNSRRPVAQFNDTMPNPSTAKLTSDTPKPIVLKTRQLMSDRVGEAKKGSDKRRENNQGSVSSKPIHNGFKSESAGLTGMKSSSISGTDRNKSLAASVSQSRKASQKMNNNGGVEMTTLNGDLVQKHTKPHHVPLKQVDGIDETDIVTKNVNPKDTPKATIQSIRNELRQTSSLNPTYRPVGKSSGSLADIA